MPTSLFASLLVLMSAEAATDTPAGKVEQAIEARSPAGVLKGTLRGQDGAAAGVPVVLFIPGSGPTDRDGNSLAGVKAAPYRMLSQALGDRGIASVRTDKRGLFASAQVSGDHTLDAYVADTRSWIEAARNRTGADCIWLLGHSEGGLVALATASKDQSGLCGLVLVATAGRPLGTVIREQLRANPANAPLVDEAERALTALEHGGAVDLATLSPPLLPLFNASAQPLLRSELTVDPAALARETSLPMLILQGERDLQVGVGDAMRLHEARGDATLVLLPDVNHVLKSVAEGPAANLAAYADPLLPIARDVTSAIADFILAPARQKPL